MPELLASVRWEPTAYGWYAWGDDFAIAVDPLDPTRYIVRRLSSGQHLFAGRIPPTAVTPDDLEWFGSVLAYDAAAASDGALVLSGAVDGLGPWLEAAQVAVDELIEADAREREEWQRSLLGRTAEELLQEVAEEVSWILPGILPRGFNLAVAGREKIGKGTWIYSQLGAAERSGMSAYIVSEEPPESTREKAQAFGLRRSRIVYGWELKAKALSWKERVPRIVKEATLDGHTFVFLDNVSRSAGIEDESGVELARAVEILQDACREAGLIFIGDFHHKKGRGSIEDKFRGGDGRAGRVRCDRGCGAGRPARLPQAAAHLARQAGRDDVAARGRAERGGHGVHRGGRPK